MLQICDGVGTLIHSATMSDVNLDILDWNLQHQHQQQRINSTSGSVVVSQAEQTGPPEPETGREERRSSVQASRSMFTIITTPRRKGGSSHSYNIQLRYMQVSIIQVNPIDRDEEQVL